MQDKCFLIVRSEPTEDRMLEEYHRWYEAHIRDLLQVPGVSAAKRFESLEGDMRYMAMYEMDDIKVFSSPEYKAVGRFGTMQSHLRFTRNVYREIPISGFAETFRFGNKFPEGRND
jgi:hypothetical protein